MTRYLVLIIFLPLLFSATASAQCTMPHGAPDAEMGVIVFNKAHKVMQYCNGDDWIGIWGGGGGSGGATPTGAVMAFDLSACPDGWSEYLPARGRFIRGIDNGAGNDPDGMRAAGAVQGDAIRNITGSFTTYFSSGNVGGSGLFVGGSNNPKGTIDSGSGYRVANMNFNASRVVPTAEENRPKNVALLYCRKN